MRIFKLFIAMVTVILLFGSCKKNMEELTPSGISSAYSIPQGNHTYDQTISSYLQKYNTNILYKFTDRDVYWSPNTYSKPVGPGNLGAWTTGVEYALADEAYVEKQLDFMQKKWFGFYSDKFLKEFLPAKILLCSKLDSIGNTFVFTPTFGLAKSTKSIGAYYFYDNITVNYGSSAIDNLTTKDQVGFVAKANLCFIQSIIARGLSKPTTEFINSADYVTTMTSLSQSYGKGIISGFNLPSAQSDWNAYITAMVSFSEANLNMNTVATDGTLQGILGANKDSSGQIRKRYNLVRNYFINEYQVDLQKIGNASKGL